MLRKNFAALVLMMAVSATSWAQPINVTPYVQLNPVSPSFDYFQSLLNLHPSVMINQYVDLYAGEGINPVRVVIFYNAGHLDALINVNNATYFAPIRFDSIVRREQPGDVPGFTLVRLGNWDDPGMSLVIRGYRVDPYSGQPVYTVVHMRMTTPDGMPLPALQVEEFSPRNP